MIEVLSCCGGVCCWCVLPRVHRVVLASPFIWTGLWATCRICTTDYSSRARAGSVVKAPASRAEAMPITHGCSSQHVLEGDGKVRS